MAKQPMALVKTRTRSAASAGVALEKVRPNGQAANGLGENEDYLNQANQQFPPLGQSDIKP